MPYQVRAVRRDIPGKDGTFYLLESGDGRVHAEIWPALGFNCLRWQMFLADTSLDLLYSDPDLFNNLRPTRTGIPVLFPFPNRIRAGRFTWAERTYQLPLNDSSKQNAIHGFACRHSWRIAGQGADDQSAWLRGEFQASVDAPDVVPFWPADYRIQLTYRLLASSLRLEITIENPDHVPLPFGLGFHPYLHVPFISGAEPDALVEAQVSAYWQLEDSLPTGMRWPLLPEDSLIPPRRYTELHLDNLYTGLEAPTPTDGLRRCGNIATLDGTMRIELLASADFTNLVLFTTPNRQALAMEPYTCTTDAINLQQQSIDAGLLVLDPGGVWSGTVELRVAQLPR